ncbi:hypothetical protein HYH03_015604 [Edaphochlamys debaryana]|uniref:Translation initiation factor eIF2B subunit beta n=1 Tax=Edaphochlamys debaryana TaxID=47281 RepID=A0A835XRN5_9CHLO|nr:hypothetical protein HYH03_015604 [Edaphochlamys debaryana]|eukprot:KAG2485720.1 hypothetical protein HYH03_015604 [Edaphochlamys debaryana]
MSEKKEIEEIVEECCAVFRRRQIEGSLPCAKRTLDILRQIVTNKRHSTAAALIDEIRTVGYRMQVARPVELAIGNMVRRVLHVIREEAKQEEIDESKPAASAPSATEDHPRGQGSGLLTQAFKGRLQMPRGPSLSNLLDDPQIFSATLAPIAEGAATERGPDPEAESQASARPSAVKGQNKKTPANWKGKHEVIESINELIDELDHIQGSITTQGVEHIHANEVILTIGMSDTTFFFLKEASKKREFQVVVAEGAPRYDGHLMARKLADAGITTTLIADSAVYAMMARANKVLVGAHAVLANGGVVAPVGMHVVALAARRHSIPFVVLVGLHKLSPLFPTDPDLLYNEFKGPADVIDFDILGEAFTQQQQLHEASTAAAHPSLASVSGLDSAANPLVSSSGPLLASGPVASAASLGGASTFDVASSSGLRWDPLPGNVHVPTPLFDYVPPQLISLFITDMGGRTPSYVYRLLTEYYSREDYFLSREVFGKDGR